MAARGRVSVEINSDYRMRLARAALISALACSVPSTVRDAIVARANLAETSECDGEKAEHSQISCWPAARAASSS